MTADLVSDTSDRIEPARMPAGPRRRLDTRTVLGAIPLVLLLAWVLLFARGTSAGSAVSEPGEFVVTLLDGLTSAGLYFIVAAGFTLIFGLMRTVNMAHGALFLLAAYIAIEVQQRMVGKDAQHRPRGRRHAVVDRSPPRRRLDRGSRRAGDVRGVPALEPGSGAAPGADHDGDRRDPRRPDARPRWWAGPVDAVAGVRHPLRRDLRPALCHQPAVHPRDRDRRRRTAVAVAQPNADGHRDPCRRRRPVDGPGPGDQHRDRVRRDVLRRGRSSPGWAA